jgi:hypothetical protein
LKIAGHIRFYQQPLDWPNRTFYFHALHQP